MEVFLSDFSGCRGEAPSLSWGGGCGKDDGFQSFGKFAVKVEWGGGKMRKRKGLLENSSSFQMTCLKGKADSGKAPVRLRRIGGGGG